MGKDFLKLKIKESRLAAGLLLTGTAIVLLLGISAFQKTKLINDCELLKNEAGAGAYEQEVIAKVKGEDPLRLTVTVNERQFSQEEAKEELERAKAFLDNYFAEKATEISKGADIVFPDMAKGTAVSVEWISKAEEYFAADGRRREEVQLTEPVEVQVAAVLSCQNYSEDFSYELLIQPKEQSMDYRILKMIENTQRQMPEAKSLILPKQYEGKDISWSKPMDDTFLYVLLLIISGIVSLKIGQEYDKKREKKERLEQLEKSYPRVISKFTMLLSAGLSIRNAWERIVKIYEQKDGRDEVIYEEMRKSLREMEKGISELEVYRNFGERVGQIHYKKLMNLFVSYKKRGNMQILETMNQEMLSAWEEKKHKIRQQGEVIGTKLLLPMMGMLAVVFCMILVPAFLSFRI